MAGAQTGGRKLVRAAEPGRGPVQVCWHKFCRYCDVELREVPMGRDVSSQPEEVLPVRREHDRCGATLGMTFTGHYEPVKEMSHALDRLQHETRPICRSTLTPPAADSWPPSSTPTCPGIFVCPRQVDQHIGSQVRTGAAGSGLGDLARQGRPARGIDLQRQLSGRRHAHLCPEFLSPGRPNRCAILQFPPAWERRIPQGPGRVGDRACYLAEKIAAMGPFEVIHDGHGGIPTVCWKLKEQSRPGFTLFDLADRLQFRGWQVPAYTLPANCETTAVQTAL